MEHCFAKPLQRFTMANVIRTLSALLAAALTACGSAPPASAPLPPTATEAVGPIASVPPGQSAAVPPRADAPLTLDGYKQRVAQRIQRVTPEIYTDPPPEVLKSIVVLELTVNRSGGLERVVMHRSNGYKNLENLAMQSVRRAAPFEAPPSNVLRQAGGSVTFLESFLFRSDDRFRILSAMR
jgi:TonB family protein